MMLGLPKTTELSKQLPKKAIYAKFQMSSAEKANIDSDISRITIVNEVSSAKLKIEDGERVKAFYVLLVSLKKREFQKKTIITISKLIDQNMLLILECGNEAKLVTYYTKLMQTEWKRKDSLTVDIKGFNMDTVWENIIVQVGGMQVEQGNTLDEQIIIDEKRINLNKEIRSLKKRAKAEKQPKKKFELSQQINRLKRELEEC